MTLVEVTSLHIRSKYPAIYGVYGVYLAIINVHTLEDSDIGKYREL